LNNKIIINILPKGDAMADTTVRSFSMSYGELIGICSSVYGFMQRDAAEFLLFGVTATKISDFDDLLQEFIQMPQDQELEATEKNKTYLKNEIANELRILLRTYTMRAKLAFGENTGTYDRFHKKDMSKLNDRDLHLFAELVKDSAEELLTQLTPFGLTQALIDEFAALITSFYNAMYEQSQAVANRDNASKDRIEKANELFGLLSRYCEIGKTIWYETNEAKYNDYIIYTSVSPGSLTAPQNLRYETDYMKVVWDAVENATSYQLEISTDGVNFTELTTITDPEFGYIPYDAHTYYKCRARNSGGYGGYSNIYDFWYYEPLPAPANFQAEIIPGHECRLSWEMVHSATTYRVYISDVAFGEPEGPFIPFLNTGQLEYTTTLTPGRRMYFKVTCFNPYQAESTFSNTSYVEVTGGTP
jgi:hypothetical protein